MGNICRSPSAEAVFRAKSVQSGLNLHIDSAGTIGYHKGNPPDSRSIKAGQARGYAFKGISARKVVVNDFEQFSQLLAMDQENFDNLMAMAPDEHKHKVKLFLHYAENYSEQEVPDPYYGGSGGFEFVLDLIEDASAGLISYIKSA